MGYATAGLQRKKGLVPYVVSAPLSTNPNAMAYLDAIVHLATWVVVWVFEALAYAAITQQEDTSVELASYPPGFGIKHSMSMLTTGSLAALVAGTVAVIGTVLAHYLSEGIAVGRLNPSVTSLLTGGIAASAFFSLVLLAGLFMLWLIFMETTVSTNCNAPQCISEPEQTAMTQIEENRQVLDYLAVLLVFKVYLLSLLVNNLHFASTYVDCYEH